MTRPVNRAFNAAQYAPHKPAPPGTHVVRIGRRDADGRALDRHEARALVRGEAVYLGADARHYLFAVERDETKGSV